MIEIIGGPELRNRSYYENLYNDICQKELERIKQVTDQLSISDEELKVARKSLSKIYTEQGKKDTDITYSEVLNLCQFTNFLTGLVWKQCTQKEQKENKEIRIKEWMERDKKRDMLIQKARPPKVNCSTCGERSIPKFKHLHLDLKKPDRVIFFYECINKCYRAFYFDNGEFYKDSKSVKPFKCSKCNSFKVDEKKTKAHDGTIYFIKECLECGEIETVKI
ncbi:hypothetical protein A2X44_02385 [candidate division CPR3 bacterium GWF2_35_18]|uniref:Uncharacterized protein n=1 Tax=candidate division CPR3 bacterium GW2011_GWF2_35_18 TaxID=1618350 RepID=A0A0G0E3X4_UNCC3|nr:MAG: hypothetical protein UR67_C0002G0160 [candidate division CPR3 bacterium GW2011_GWF2_35_18]OGB62843.1 MAG: hypothetical protein A2X44_02385 [candidate division CPR3 bacterium GWF2_35_18]OGB65424.1 MAG: hypothetical protein A2250_00600 [candidate division CPR3 bacterium RIFOXYA2_FULL_35_13]OGB76389.1 MAG: hypothetical protein A2476_01225 [candidate division CPR3 bacterium RIFOXYC2_FULL_35_7]OGB79534.1 MAG: hypothetical protein A2296_00390 [candidate division CPR3 bacterium RIFOXYB2_FULL_3